jgi:quinoprotein glucose dehydrogenase
MICEHMKKILTVSLAIVILLGIFSLSGAALPLVKNVVHSMPPEYQTPIKNTLNSVQSTIKNTFYSAKWEFKIFDKTIYELIANSKNKSQDQDVEWRYSSFDQQGSRSVVLKTVPKESWTSPVLVWTGNDTLGVGSQVQSSAGFFDNKILTRTAAGHFIAIGLNGDILWRYEPSRGVFAKRGWSSAIINGESRLLASEGKFLKCINTSDGSNCKGFGSNGYAEVCHESKINPIVHDDRVILLGSSFCITSIDLINGNVVYSKPLNKDNLKNFGGSIWSNAAYYKENKSIIFGTANAKPDFDGRSRPGDNNFSNSIVSVDLMSGEINWAFQEIAHDLWDLDTASPPVVAQIHSDKLGALDVVIAVTKLGNTLVLNASTGELLNDFKLVDSEKSLLLGEYTPDKRLQIVSPEPFAKMEIQLDDLSFLKSYDLDEYEKAKHRLKNGISGYLKPHIPGKTSYYSGIHGGAQWPGGAYDHISQTFFTASNHIPWAIEFDEAPSQQLEINRNVAGADIFELKCLSCHQGNLQKIDGRTKNKSDSLPIKEILINGYGTMPKVDLMSDEMIGILQFLKHENAFLKTNIPAFAPSRFAKFITGMGNPVTNPPWGSVNAINLSGDTFSNAWKVPIGNSALGKEKGIVTGTEVFGGITFVDSGVLLISGTSDNKLYVLDSSNGDIIWEYEMPTHGAAAPIVFRSNGIVYFFVQATGLGKLGGSNYSKTSYYHLFALPK